MNCQINIFEGADGITGGDVVLMIEHISAVAGSPDAGD